MDIAEMEENGTADYYLDLRDFIKKFVNRNYPLSQEDLRSILQDNPTEKVIERQETEKILNEAMEEILTDVANTNNQIIEGANEGNYTPYSIQDYRNDISEFQQKMLEKLWKKRHNNEKQIQCKKGEQTTEKDDEQEI